MKRKRKIIRGKKTWPTLLVPVWRSRFGETTTSCPVCIDPTGVDYLHTHRIEVEVEVVVIDHISARTHERMQQKCRDYAHHGKNSRIFLEEGKGEENNKIVSEICNFFFLVQCYFSYEIVI